MNCVKYSMVSLSSIRAIYVVNKSGIINFVEIREVSKLSIKSKMTEKTLKDLEKMTGIKLTIGKLIWAIRRADEISQVVFAKTLHITKQHLCDIEHDRKSVSPKLAAQYAEILGYSKEQFIRLSLQDLIDREDNN